MVTKKISVFAHESGMSQPNDIAIDSKDRVYASDIKKVVQWYNLLQKHDLLSLLDENNSEETKSDEEE